MRNHLIKLMIFTGILYLQANATIWRVDNVSLHDADFTDLQSAHDGASAGDTLYVAGTDNDNGDCILTKKLTIIGNGYFKFIF